MNEETGKKIEFLRWWKETNLVVSVEHPGQDYASEAWCHQQEKIDRLEKENNELKEFVKNSFNFAEMFMVNGERVNLKTKSGE